MAIRMQQRRGTATQWTSANPTLAAGEIGYETDTGKFKIGNGSSTWSNISYYASADDIAGLIDGAPGVLDTLNELAAAVNDDPNFFATVALDLANHEADTTNVHGIADMSLLTTQTDLNTAVSTHSSDTTEVHGIADTLALATQTNVTDAILAHSNDTTGVHGIADTSALATQTDVSTAQEAAEDFATSEVSTHNSNTTNVHGIANTESLALLTDVSTAQEAAESHADTAVSDHNAETTNVHGIVNTADLTTTTDVNTLISNHNAVTTNVHGIADTADLVLTDDARLSDTRTPTDNTVSTEKIVNSAVTADKLAGNAVTEAKIANGAVTSGKIADGAIVNADINAAAAIDWTKLGISSTVSSTELGYVAGVTSAIQTQINAVPGLIATAKSEAIADATSQINAVLDSAPEALNTLNELAAALGDDANFASTVTTALDGKVASYTPIIQKTDSYTLSSTSERDSLIEMGKATAQTLTIPTNASVAFPVGASLDILQTGAGQVTIAGAGGVTVNGTPGLKLRTQWSSATLFKRATDTWIVMGDLSA